MTLICLAINSPLGSLSEKYSKKHMNQGKKMNAENGSKI